MRYIDKTNTLWQRVAEIYDRINSLSGSREEIGSRLKSLYGSMGTKGFITHVADNLEYSGLTVRLGWLTPELYIVIMTILSALLFAVGCMISGSLYVGIAVSAALWAAAEYMFARLRDYRYHKEEEQLLALVNCVESCAAESDDIIYILEKTAGMLEGPLHDELTRTVGLVKSGIQGGVALRGLEHRIEHEFFRTLIRNLEISSRNNANYREITAQCRNLLSEQLDNSKKLEGIYKEARMRLLTILAGSVVCLDIMAQTMLDMKLDEMFVMFSKSLIGSLLLAAIAGTLIFTMYFALFKGSRGRI